MKERIAGGVSRRHGLYSGSHHRYHRTRRAQSVTHDHERSEELEALIHAQLERWEELETKARATTGGG